MRGRKGLIFAALAVWCAMSGVAAAQSTGSVAGTVKDRTSGVIPGVTVVLINEAQGTKLAPAVTNQTGDYTFPIVAVGTYTIEVTMPGFKTLQLKGIAVSSGDRVSIAPLVIEVGGVSEVVNVAAESPLIQARSGERSYTVTTEAVQNLPISSRSFIELGSLAPGVAVGAVDPNANAGAGSFYPPMRLGGGSGVNNTITLDGAGIIDTGGANIRLAPNVDAIAEVKVVVAAGQAEYGRGSGVQISGITKSGSNQFRGSIYDVRRSSDWNSNDWVNQQRGLPKLVRKEDDFGFTIGGPIGKPGGTNKLFFFFSDEWRPRTAGGERSQFRVPTALERQGDFSQTRNNNGQLVPYVRDYQSGPNCSATNTANCFADGGVLGRIPKNRLYQVGLNLLSQWPQPNLAENDPAYVGSNSYNYENIRPNRSGYLAQHSLRVDYQVTPNLRANAKVVYETKNKVVNSPNIAFGQSANFLNGYNDALETQPQQFQYTTNVNYNITPKTFAEFTWGMFQNQTGSPTVSPLPNIGDFPMLFPDSRIVDPQFYLHKRFERDSPPWVSNDAQGNLILLLPPTLTFGNLIAFAPPPYPGWNCCVNVNTVNNVTASVTRVEGRHTIKAGYWFEHSLKEQTSGSFRPAVTFTQSTNNPFDTGFPFANAAIGTYSSYSQSSRFLASGFFSVNHDAFIQDNWKVTQRLTLDYGMRFVHQVPGHDGYGNASNFVPSSFDASKSMDLYRPVCAPGATVPCTGNNLRALNPVTGEILPAAQSSLIGTKVPNSGDNLNGVFLAGTGPVPDTTFKHPALVYGPRLGVAYDVTGEQKFVVRGGFGLYFDRPFGTAGPVGQPPTSVSSTLSNGLLADVRPGAGTSSELSVSGVTSNQLMSKIATSVQWNSGVQMAVPWSMVLDVAYAGSYNYNERASVDVNGLGFGALYLPQNQDPTRTPSAATGASAYATNFIRPMQGWGAINQTQFFNWNKFHSLQTSLNRRFSNGLQFNVNYTFSRSYGTDGQGVRVDLDGRGGVTLRADQDELVTRINSGATGSSDQPHVARVNFVWDTPDIRADTTSGRVLGYVLNDWIVSGVFNVASGLPYSLSYSYQAAGSPSGSQLTGSTIYNPRIILGDGVGSGCSSDLTRQFGTATLMGPTYNSLGLESKNNTLRGCAYKKMDMALARTFRMGGVRTLQLRIETYNLFDSVNITDRNTSVQFTSIDQRTTIVNLPYAADGSPRTTTSAVPGANGAGLGVVTTAAPLRAVQAQVRFSF